MLSKVEYMYSEPLPITAVFGSVWGAKLELHVGRASTEAIAPSIPKSVTAPSRARWKFGRPSEATVEEGVDEPVGVPQALSAVAQVERELRKGRRKELFIADGTFESVEVLVKPAKPALFNKETVTTLSLPEMNRRRK